MRNYPQCCEPVDLTRYSYDDIPTENGASVGYYTHTSDHCDSDDPEQWFETMTCSDYTGGTLGRSNLRVMTAILAEHHPVGESPAVWLETHGGHGTAGLLVRYFALHPDARAALDSYDDYPCIDESDYSELECEEQDEGWERWARADFARALRCELFNAAPGYDPHAPELPEAVETHLATLFHAATEVRGYGWEDSDIGQSVRVEPLAKIAAELITGERKPPTWLNPDAWSAFLECEAAVANTRFRAQSLAWFQEERS